MISLASVASVVVSFGPVCVGDLPDPLDACLTDLRSAAASQVAVRMAQVLRAEPEAIAAFIERLCDPAKRDAALEEIAADDEEEATRIQAALPDKVADATTVRILIGPYLLAHVTHELDVAFSKRLKTVEGKYKKAIRKLLTVVPRQSGTKRKHKLEVAKLWRARIAPAIEMVEDRNVYRDEDRGASAQKAVDSKVRKLWRAHLSLLREFDDDLKRFRRAKLEDLTAALALADEWRAAHTACFELLAKREGVDVKPIDVELDGRIRLGRAMLRVTTGDAAGARALAEGHTGGAGPMDVYDSSLLRYLHFERVLKYNDSVDVDPNAPVDAIERDVVRRLNLYRVALDREPLEIEKRLLSAARGHSTEMTVENYFAHDSPHPEQATFSNRIKRAGYENVYVGECIYSGIPGMDGEDVFMGWYGSSIHHRLLISTTYAQIGVGRDGKLVTANLGADRVLESW